MIDDSKQTRSSVEGTRGKKEKSTRKSNTGFHAIPVNSDIIIPVGSGVLQILVGLTLVAVSILGLISPLWLSAVLSLAGSISCMAGIFLIYHVVSSRGTFESLINQSIRRVISAQN
jgi:uncharacterized membrane protein